MQLDRCLTVKRAHCTTSDALGEIKKSQHGLSGESTWNIINDNTKTPTSHKDVDKKKITMKVCCI